MKRKKCNTVTSDKSNNYRYHLTVPAKFPDLINSDISEIPDISENLDVKFGRIYKVGRAKGILAPRLIDWISVRSTADIAVIALYAVPA